MEFTSGNKYQRGMYFLGLLAIAFGLSISKVVISLGVMLLGVSWLWEANFAAKWRLLLARKSVFVLIAFYVLHVVGLLWTSDMNDGLKDVRIKLPLLLIPLIIGTSAPLNKKQLETLLLFFGAGVLIASVRTYLIVKGIIPKKIVDIRDASDLVPLIRLALFSALTIMFCGRWFIRNANVFIRGGCVAVTAWLLYFMIYMQSLTGLIVLFAAITIITIIMAALNRRRKLLFGILALVIVAAGIGSRSIYRAYKDFYALRGNENPELLVQSATGRLYLHEPEVPMFENGHKVMVNLCWTDLLVEWSKRSKVDFHHGRDPKGNLIPYTLVRYMASRGLAKDSAGMAQLSDEEIRQIENGCTNYKDAERDPLERRAYQVFWETYNFAHGGNPSGSSVTMRVVVAQTALQAVSDHPWIGTGTGSQKKTYDSYYTAHGTRLSENYQWLHAHNQFLSVAVTLGIPAMLFFIYTLWWPVYNMRRWKSYLYLAFFVIVVLSFLDDDTLETQQGATFYAFFNSLLLYAMPFVSSLPGKKTFSEEEQPLSATRS